MQVASQLRAPRVQRCRPPNCYLASKQEERGNFRFGQWRTLRDNDGAKKFRKHRKDKEELDKQTRSWTQFFCMSDRVTCLHSLLCRSRRLPIARERTRERRRRSLSSRSALSQSPARRGRPLVRFTPLLATHAVPRARLGQSSDRAPLRDHHWSPRSHTVRLARWDDLTHCEDSPVRLGSGATGLSDPRSPRRKHPRSINRYSSLALRRIAMAIADPGTATRPRSGSLRSPGGLRIHVTGTPSARFLIATGGLIA